MCLLLAGGACARGENAEPTMDLTQRQRDSAIGASKLPGAHGVTRALGAADSAAARNTRLDSLAADRWRLFCNTLSMVVSGAAEIEFGPDPDWGDLVELDDECTRVELYVDAGPGTGLGVDRQLVATSDKARAAAKRKRTPGEYKSISPG
jgi:hypothetical protein